MAFNGSDLKAKLKNDWNALDESQRATRRFVFGGLLLVVIAAPLVFFGRPLWRRWQQRDSLEQARVFAQKDDYRSAALALRRAIVLAPDDPATWQEAVAVLREIGSPEVLAAQQQLSRLRPEDSAVKLALATDALRFERFDVAETTVAGLDAAARRDAAFYRLTASLAFALGRTRELEENLEKLVAVAPGDAAARFNLAAVRLWSVEPEERAAAGRELDELTGDSTVRIRASLELLKAAARENDQRVTSATIARLLKRYVPGLPAETAGGTQAAWLNLQEQMKAAAAGRAEDAALLARWLADLGQRREALLWLEGLAPAVSGALAVREVAAELSAELGELDRLEKYLQGGAWGAWPRDALTLALAARLQKLRYSEPHARDTWGDALAAAGASPAALKALVRLANAWGDAEGVERALEAAVATGPAGEWAYGSLRTLYANRRDLGKLFRLHESWVRVRPADTGLAVEWIALGCLLDRVGPELAARAEALAQSPAPETRRLLAAVRWRQGRARDAVDLLSALPAEVRAQPATALWLGVAQAEVGNRNLAREALAVAWAGRLGPEETALVRAAAGKVGFVLPQK